MPATVESELRGNQHLLLLGPRGGRPGRLRRRGPRDRPPAQRDRADRLGEHRQPRGAGGRRLGPHQQVCRGLSGPALLRRLPVRRRGGDAGHRSRQAAVRLQLRQRAAEFRQPGQPGRAAGAGQARRHHPRAVAGGGRAPHPRRGPQPVGQVVQGRALRRAPRGPAHRPRRGGRTRPRAPAAHHRRRRLGLPAHHRLRPLPRHRRRGRRHPDGGHGALRRPGRRRRASEPARARPCRHQHHAQDAARPARRADPHQPRGHRPARSTRRCSPACRAAR